MAYRTYIKLIPSRETVGQIVGVLKGLRLGLADFVAEPHCTIIYSRQVVDVADITLPEIEFPIIAHSPRLMIFDELGDGRNLVIEFDCDVAAALHYDIKYRYDIATRHEDYRPHITIRRNVPLDELPRRMPHPLGIPLRFLKLRMDNGK